MLRVPVTLLSHDSPTFKGGEEERDKGKGVGGLLEGNFLFQKT